MSLFSSQDVSMYLSKSGLESLASKFMEEEMDGDAVKLMMLAWNNGQLHHYEIKRWFNVQTVGQLFKLKRELDYLVDKVLC